MADILQELLLTLTVSLPTPVLDPSVLLSLYTPVPFHVAHL